MLIPPRLACTRWVLASATNGATFRSTPAHPGKTRKPRGQGDVGGEVRWEGDAHDAHARITASGRIGSARRVRLCRPALSLRVVASRPVLPQAAVLVVSVQTRIAASGRIGLWEGASRDS